MSVDPGVREAFIKEAIWHGPLDGPRSCSRRIRSSRGPTRT